MTGQTRVWPVKPTIRPDIVRWPAVILSPGWIYVFRPKCRLGFCAKLSIAVNKWKRETLSCVDPHATFLCLSLLHLVQFKQIVKVKYMSTHQTLIRGKTLRFPRSFLSQNVTHRIRVVTKYQDFYHCGIWLHHHNSRGFHVRFYSVKQSLTPTTYFFMF